MKKLKENIWIMLGLFLLILVIPSYVIFFFYDKAQFVNVLAMGFTLMGSFASILAIPMAYIGYKKFIVDERVLINQTDKVLGLAAFLRKNTIQFYDSNRKNYVGFSLYKLSKQMFSDEMISIKLNNSICVDHRNFDSFLCDLSVLVSDRNMPESIQEKSKLVIEYFPNNIDGIVDAENISDFTEVIFNTVSSNTKSCTVKKEIGHKNDGNIEICILNDFLVDVVDFVGSVKLWLDEHTKDSEALYRSIQLHRP